MLYIEQVGQTPQVRQRTKQVTRNQLIKAAYSQAEIAETSGKLDLSYCLRNFANDLVPVPCDKNRNQGVICYTMRQALKEWRAFNVAP